MTKRSKSHVAIAPGATIAEQLEDRVIPVEKFAVLVDMSVDDIKKLIKGDIELTPEIASALTRALGVPEEFWLGLEKLYREELLLVEQEAG